MRIAVDARPFEECPTGVGRYLDGLLSAWLRARPEDSFVLLSPRPVHVPPRLEGRVAVPPTPALFGTIWLQTAAGPAARRAGADAFLGSLAILPLACGLPGVATVHDLTPILFPEWHSRKNRFGFTPFIGATVRRARRIAAVSEATRRDLVAAFPDAAGKTRVVHNGIEPEAPVAGGVGWGMGRFAEDVARSRHANRITLAGYLGAGERARWLRDARVFAYPSPVSYTHLRAHETRHDLVCRLLLEKKKHR